MRKPKLLLRRPEVGTLEDSDEGKGLVSMEGPMDTKNETRWKNVLLYDSNALKRKDFDMTRIQLLCFKNNS